MDAEKTYVPVSIETRDRLRALGKEGDSYNTIIEWLLDAWVDDEDNFTPLTPSWLEQLYGIKAKREGNG